MKQSLTEVEMNNGYDYSIASETSTAGLKEISVLLRDLIETLNATENEPLWTATDVGNFLQVSEASVVKNYFYLPGFPKGFRLPSKKGLGGRRWHGQEIREWCDKQKSF